MDPKKKSEKRVKVIAQQLGTELIVKDISKQFKKEVVDDFVNEYEKGNTPNPCVICNPKVKFKELLKVADELGTEKVATGHYACVESSVDDAMDGTMGDPIGAPKNVFTLHKAEDPTKDQSYFLYRLGQRELSRIVFPLCRSKKQEIKKEADKLELRVEKEESQDVCFFLKDEKLNQFLAKRIEKRSGLIVDEEGNKLGEHKGIFFYTIGQRHGLGLQGGPHYVIDKKTKKNEIVVSGEIDHPKLWTKRIKIEKANWISSSPLKNKKYGCQVRYQTKQIDCLVKKKNAGLIVEMKKAAWGVTPGQSLVIYDGQEVVGGGVIAG